MTIIQPPSNSRPTEADYDPPDITVCCRAAYTTRLCFSNKPPKWLVHWHKRGPQAYCDDCIPIVQNIIELMFETIRIEEIK